MAGTWTYSFDPTTSTLDEIRFLIGDVDSAQSWSLKNEEINYNLTVTDNIYLAAALAAEAIAAKFAQTADSKHIGDMTVSWQKRYQQFMTLARQLRNRATLKAVSVQATGLSWEEKRAQDADPDRVAPAAKTDGMNLPARLDRDATTGV